MLRGLLRTGNNLPMNAVAQRKEYQHYFVQDGLLKEVPGFCQVAVLFSPERMF